MFKFGFLFLTVVVFGIVFPAHGLTRSQRQRNRYFARQMLVEEVTPYPSADELRPEIPFEEGSVEPVQPGDFTPDEVYGPPEKTHTPDEVYGPPEVSENDLPTIAEGAEPAAEAFQVPVDEQQARLINFRRRQRFQRQQQFIAGHKPVARPLKLRVTRKL